MRLSDYHYPYSVLISKLLIYFEVNLEDETFELVKSTQEMNNGSLSKMGFTKINGKWVSKDGDCTAQVVGSADVAPSYSVGVLTRRQSCRREGGRGVRVVASY